MKLILRFVLLVTIAFASRGSAQSAATSSEVAQPKHVFTKDMTVYVRDFEPEAQNVQVDKGAGGQVRSGLIAISYSRKAIAKR